MGKEGADDDPKKMENRKKSKSKKHEKNEDSSMGIDESQSIGSVKETKHMLRGEEKKQHRRDKEEKKKKGTKDIKGVDIEKKGFKESKRVYGEDVNDDATGNAERKSKKREKKNKIEGNKSKNLLEEESVYGVKCGKEAKKKRKKNRKDGDIKKVGDTEDGKVLGAHNENSEVNVMGIVERKKRKREKKRSTSECEKISETLNEANIEDFAEKTEGKKKRKKMSNVQSNEYDGNVTGKLERDKKKEKYKNNENYNDNDSHIAEHADKGKKKKKIKLVDNDSVTPTPNKSNKKVRFSGEDEVFTLPGVSSENYGEDGLLRGKYFTPEEDEIVQEAVLKYIAENDLGDEGLDMVLNSIKHPKLRGLWKEIGSAIPYRPYLSIYGRAQVLFRRSEERKWTQEEYDMLIKYQEEHGNNWRPLADELGKHTRHVERAWCRVKLKDRKRGHWSQSEYQRFFDLVHTDLKLRVCQEKKSRHGMLRDNICWGAISDELSTRSTVSCCNKWYYQLTSRMVMEGVWADSDDYRLVGALYELDATCVEDVDWDELVDGRSGELCRKRWSQMVLHIGQHRLKTFGEQVEVMAQRYCPHLLEVREIWDSKPRVP